MKRTFTLNPKRCIPGKSPASGSNSSYSYTYSRPTQESPHHRLNSPTLAHSRTPTPAHFRRGGAPALVLCLYLALGSVLLAAVSLAAMSNGAAERDYCRSQALALAEGGIAEARTGGAPHGLQPLGVGEYAWTAVPAGAGRRITARGEVIAASGARITRSVTVLLGPGGKLGTISAWEEGP